MVPVVSLDFVFLVGDGDGGTFVATHCSSDGFVAAAHLEQKGASDDGVKFLTAVLSDLGRPLNRMRGSAATASQLQLRSVTQQRLRPA